MNSRNAYHELREQIRDHDTVLGYQKARARALLGASAVLLGIMGISLGNFAGFVLGNYGVVGEAGMFPIYAIVTTIMLGMAGLAGAMISMIFSARALAVSYTHQPMASENFGTGGNVDDKILDRVMEAPDHYVYVSLIKSCIRALHSREQNIARVGARSAVAQLSLLSGLMLAGIGAIVALSVIALAFLL